MDFCTFSCHCPSSFKIAFIDVVYSIFLGDKDCAKQMITYKMLLQRLKYLCGSKLPQIYYNTRRADIPVIKIHWITNHQQVYNLFEEYLSLSSCSWGKVSQSHGYNQEIVLPATLGNLTRKMRHLNKVSIVLPLPGKLPIKLQMSLCILIAIFWTEIRNILTLCS